MSYKVVSTFCALLVALTSCSDACNGHIESSVLYFKEGLNHHGQLVYANVLNDPKLGTQQTLMREDKEYGTFPHVIIISDPEMKYKGRQTVCFDEFAPQPAPADLDLRERDIPRILITK